MLKNRTEKIQSVLILTVGRSAAQSLTDLPIVSWLFSHQNDHVSNSAKDTV